MDDRKSIEQQDRFNAEQFLNANITPKFAPEAESGWSKLKNIIANNKGTLALGALGSAAGAYLGDTVNEELNQNNIENLQTGKEALDHYQKEFDNLKLDELDDKTHYMYRNQINTNNKVISQALQDMNNTPFGEDRQDDIDDTKDYLARKIFDAPENGPSIYDTLSPDVKEALQNNGIVPGYSDGIAGLFNIPDSYTRSIQDKIEKLVDDHQQNTDLQYTTASNGQIPEVNKEYVAAETTKFQNKLDTQATINNDLQKRIDDHPSTKLPVQVGSAVGAALAGVGAKKLYDRHFPEGLNNFNYNQGNQVNPMETGASGASRASEETKVSQLPKESITINNDPALISNNISTNQEKPKSQEPETLDSFSGTGGESSLDGIGKLDTEISPSLPKIKKPSFMHPDDRPVSQGEYNRRYNIPDIREIQVNTPLNLDGNIERPGDKRYKVTTHPIT